MRVRMLQRRMTGAQADMLHYFLLSLDGVTKVTVSERTADATILYNEKSCSREKLIAELSDFGYERTEVAVHGFGPCGARTCFAASAEAGLLPVQSGSLSAGRPAMSVQGEAGSTCAGCDYDRCLTPEGGLRHCGISHVPFGCRRASGGVDS